MTFEQVTFASPAFDDVLRLRDEVLRQPLNLQFTIKQITDEYTNLHFACYDKNRYLLGTLMMKEVAAKYVKMRQVAVAPSAQGQGVGSFMVKQLEQWMLHHSQYRSIQLAARTEAVSFYKKLGYTVKGAPFVEVGIPHRHMEKIL